MKHTVIVSIVICLATSAAPLAAQSCVPSETVACFLENRFQAEITFANSADNEFTLPGGALSGSARVAQGETASYTALFYFRDPDRPVVMLKVLDGVRVNGYFWVFASATTNEEVTLTVTDTVTGQVLRYLNPLYQPFPSITDTAAFPGGSKAAGEEIPKAVGPAGTTACGPEMLCLQQGRFEVTVTWGDFSGNHGPGQSIPYSDSSGIFWFFDDNNWEMLVNVIDGRGANGHFWFYTANTTNVELEVTVHDTLTGRIKTYYNPFGTPFPTILDNQAFPEIAIEAATAGIDADWPPGPYFEVGAPVEWTYQVTNFGGEEITGITVTDDQVGAVTCPGSSLQPGENMTCSASGVVADGPYENLATVTGTMPDATIVQATDLSHHTGFTRDPEARVLYIPAAASVPGSNETLWKSSLQLNNIDWEDWGVLVGLLEHGEDNSAAIHRMVTATAEAGVRLEDVLANQFAFEGSAALRLDIPAAAGDRVNANSRTYNQGPDGTYGQFIPAIDEDDAHSFGDRPRLIQLSSSDSDDEGFRTNIGFLNITAAPCTVRAALHDGSTGDLFRFPKRDLAPFEFQQINDAFSGLGTIDDAFAVLSTTTEGCSYLGYASVIDNRTGDPVFILPAAASSTGMIAAAARVDGSNQTVWRSDLAVHEAGGKQDLACEIALWERGRQNDDPDTTEITVPAGRSLLVADILDDAFDFEGGAALHLTCDEEAMVTSKTFNQGPEGSFGQFIPMEPDEDVLEFGDPVVLMHLNGSAADDTGFRTNVGLVNRSPYEADYWLDIYDAERGYLETMEQTLGPFEYVQINRIFRQIDAGTVNDAYVIVSGAGRVGDGFHCYASVVDNRTGDPTYILPEPFTWPEPVSR